MADEAQRSIGNPYKLEVIIANLGRIGERIQRLMMQAKVGTE